MKETIYAIGYARISSKKQNTGSGLENQEEAILLHATKNGWTLFPNGKVIKEIASGRKMHISQRPEYMIARKLILENPNKVKYFIINKIDRSTRAGSEEYMWFKNDLLSLGVELRDTQNIIQPSVNTLEHRGVGYSWSNKSPSSMTEIIIAEIGKDEVSNILTRTMDTSILRIETGNKLRESQFGYKNQKVVGVDGKEKSIQVRDEVEGQYMEAIFEKTIEGVMTEQEIVDYVNSLGYKSRERRIWSGEKQDKKIIGVKEGKKLDIKQMQKYRKNPIYAGVNIEKWGETTKRTIIAKTDYKSLVSIATFNQANKGKIYIEELPSNKVKIFYGLQLEKVIKRRLKFRTEYVFKNVVLCDICREPFLASKSKGKSGGGFDFYHCDRTHKYYGVPKKDIDVAMMTFLSKLKFSDKYYKVFEKVLTWRYEQEHKKSLENQIALNENITLIQTRMKQSMDAYKETTNKSMKVGYQEEYDTLENELYVARIERKKLELDFDELSSFLRYAKNLMEHPIEMFLNVNTYNEQMAIYKILFIEFPTYQEVLNGTPKLSLFFKVGSENSDEQSLAVTPRRVELRLPA